MRILAMLLLVLSACGSGDKWQAVQRNLPGALLSVWGASATDVWAVGGDPGDGRGPMALHFDGTSWKRLDTGQVGDLWWVFGFAGGPIYMGGDGGVILSYAGGAFTKMSTPGTDVVFGIWGSSPSDVWAVGGATGGARGGFAWRLNGDKWENAPGFPASIATTDAIWKIAGRSANDVWMVGTNGKVVRFSGSPPLTEMTTGGESLFTVHANSKRFAAVGGFGTGIILENEGANWVNATPPSAQALIGVVLTETGGYAVGQYGSVYRRGSDGWKEEMTGFTLDESLHSVWVDPSGGVWAVGGQVLTAPLVRGIMLHKGSRTIPGGLQ